VPAAAHIELRMPTVKVDCGKVDVGLGPAESPTAVLTGKPELILNLLTGRMTIADATANGLAFQGPAAAVRRVVPAAVPAKKGRASK
jgi:hypothetical protein